MPDEPTAQDDDGNDGDGNDGDGYRPSRWVRRAPLIVTIVAAVVLVIGTIGPPLFGQGTFLASDLLYQHAWPWKAVADTAPLGELTVAPLGDTVDAAFPDRASFGEAARDGSFAEWNPYVAGGQPLGMTSQSGVLSPFAWAFVLLPSWFAPAAVKALGMAAAIGFTFLFLRRLGAGRVPAVLAGVAYAGSGFMLMWTNWPQPDVAALVPALFWATERCLQRRTDASTIPIAVVLAAMLLGQFPSVVGYALYVLVPYVALRLLYERGRPLRQRMATGAWVGAGLAAGVVLVAAILLPFAARLGDSNLDERAQSPQANLRVASLMTTVAPDAFGLDTEQNPATPGTERYQGPANQIEALSWLGATTVVLALFAALPRPRRTPRGVLPVLVGAIAVLGVATYAGGPLLQLLQNLPVFADNFVGRTRSVLGFMVAVLAGIGLQALWEARWPLPRRAWLRLGAAAGITGAVALLVLWRSVQWVRPLGGGDQLTRSLVAPVVVGVLALGAAHLVVRGRGWVRGAASAGLVVLLAGESLALAVPLLPSEDRSTLYPETAATRFLQDNIGHDRMAVESSTYFGNSVMFYGLRSATGHGFHTTAWKEMLLAADPSAFSASPTWSRLGNTPEVVGSPILDRLGTRWFAAVPEAPIYGEPGELTLAQASCPGDASTDSDDADAGQATTATLPADDGLRAVVVEVCTPVPVPADATLVVEATADGTTVTGTKQLGPEVPAGELQLPVPGDVLAGADEVDVTVELRGAPGAELSLATTPDGELAIDVLRPTDDGLRLAFADELVVYERTTALPRVRWAGRAEVVTDDVERLELLTSGDVADDTVVLSSGEPGGDGEAAEVQLDEDGAEETAVTVDAEGDGWLVVSDSIQSDWTATVDGETVDLVAADHAGVAIPVPEGRHEVRVTLAPRGQTPGLLLGVLTALGLGAVAVLERRRRHRARDGAAADGSDVDGRGVDAGAGGVVAGSSTNDEDGDTGTDGGESQHLTEPASP